MAGEAILVEDTAVLQLWVICTAQSQEVQRSSSSISTPCILLTAVLTPLGRLLSPRTHLGEPVLQQKPFPSIFLHGATKQNE